MKLQKFQHSQKEHKNTKVITKMTTKQKFIIYETKFSISHNKVDAANGEPTYLRFSNDPHRIDNLLGSVQDEFKEHVS